MGSRRLPAPTHWPLATFPLGAGEGESVGLVKRYRDGLDRELAKATALRAIAERHGFLAPAVLGFDRPTNTIRYQRFDRLAPLRDRYLSHMTGSDPEARCVRAVRLAGRTLAIIHRELSPGPPSPWEAPPTFARVAGRVIGPDWHQALGATPQVVLHGDYGFGNVQLAGDSDTITVLDPSPNYYLTFDPLAQGSAYLDLGTMLGCLGGLVPLRTFLRLEWSRLPELERALIGGYQDEAGVELDAGLLRGVATTIITTYLRRRLGSEPLAIAATWVMRTLSDHR